MIAYPILQSGEKLVKDDVNAIAQVAGTVADALGHGSKQIWIETTNRQGWVEPFLDGPLVLPNGGTGTVLVQPFTMWKSPAGATAGGGTSAAVAGVNEDASSGLASAWFPGTGAVGIAIATPLPAAASLRWDMLIAIYSEADGTAASRLVKDPVTGIIAAQTINTRHAPAVTLGWIQGTSSTIATDPYPLGSMPVLPAPPAGQAYVCLGYVQIQNSGTPGTVTYTFDRIANQPRAARQNAGTGIASVGSGGVSGRKATAGSLSSDIVSIISALPVASGGWPNSGTNIRPQRFVEPIIGSVTLWIPIGPFSTAGGAANTFLSNWQVLGDPIATPATAFAVFADRPFDWRNRVFISHLNFIQSTNSFAWELTAATPIMPTVMGVASGVGTITSWGNSVRENANFIAEHANLTGYRLAALFRKVGGVAGLSDLALVVSTATGALHLAGRDATGTDVNQGTGMIHLTASQSMFPLGL